MVKGVMAFLYFILSSTFCLCIIPKEGQERMKGGRNVDERRKTLKEE